MALNNKDNMFNLIADGLAGQQAVVDANIRAADKKQAPLAELNQKENEMYIHEQIIEACVKIAQENELTDTIEILGEMNHAAFAKNHINCWLNERNYEPHYKTV